MRLRHDSYQPRDTENVDPNEPPVTIDLVYETRAFHPHIGPTLGVRESAGEGSRTRERGGI